MAWKVLFGMSAIKDRHLGRPIKMTPAKRKRVIAMLRKTGNMSAAAKAIKVSRQALYEWCAVERRNGKYIVVWKKD